MFLLTAVFVLFLHAAEAVATLCANQQLFMSDLSHQTEEFGFRTKFLK